MSSGGEMRREGLCRGTAGLEPELYPRRAAKTLRTLPRRIFSISTAEWPAAFNRLMTVSNAEIFFMSSRLPPSTSVAQRTAMVDVRRVQHDDIAISRWGKRAALPSPPFADVEAPPGVLRQPCVVGQLHSRLFNSAFCRRCVSHKMKSYYNQNRASGWKSGRTSLFRTAR